MQNWYDVRQAADYLGMTPSGLRKLINRREVAYTQSKPHSPIRFRQEWLDTYLESITHRTADPEAPATTATCNGRKPRCPPPTTDRSFGLDWSWVRD